jgi:hypothetical protein
MVKTLLRILLVTILLIAVFILPLYHPSGMAVYLRLFLLIFIFIESIKLFKIIFIDTKINKIISNSATVLLSIFALFIFLEAIFMFIPRSHSADCTLASSLWYAKYWKPVNSLGFRDNEPTNSKHVILFVGDSFTAGHGLKSVEERYSNLVGKELNKNNSKYTVVNIGKPGADTLGEYYLMKNFIYTTRIKPEKIVLQYCGNDIEYVAQENGVKFDGYKLPRYMNKFVLFIGSGSYLINYIYWLFPRDNFDAQYIAFLHHAYKNDDIFSKHKDELQLFVNYARENSIQLIVVAFPFLTALDMSDALYVNNIVHFFEANKITVINVSSLVRDIPDEERIINVNDGHASKTVNRIVAEEILKKWE